MKKTLVTILVLLSALTLHAGQNCTDKLKRATFGAEWNYISSFHCGIHHNFFSEVGYRVDIKNMAYGYKSNADLYLHCGYNLNEDWNLALYTGVAGVYDISKIVSISLRATHYFKPDIQGDRWLAFVDGGSGISLTRHPQPTAEGKIGCGYRIALSNATKLDVLMAYRVSLSHPEIEFDGFSVPKEKINRNNAYVSALSFGLALTF